MAGAHVLPPSGANSADELLRATTLYFAAHAADFGLERSSLAVDYVLNWGGFVNFSYRVTDGRTRLHVKLSTTPEGRAALRRWHDLDPLLRPHRAPPVVARVDVGGATGLVFAWLPGAVPDFDADVAAPLVECASKLWADAELGARLRWGPPVTAADGYLDTYHDRFEADLAAIESHGAPFPGSADLHAMRSEADLLKRRVLEAAAFHEEVTNPIHGDLWMNNVLWQSRNAWWVLDWDDVRIGDPAMDLAMLTGPTARDLRPLKHFDHVRGSVTAVVAERLTLLGRAALLDWVIDPLADWIEATVAPDHLAEVRSEKERVHKEAWALYREMYPS